MATSSTALATLDRRAFSAGTLVQRITGAEGAQQQRRLHRVGGVRGAAKGINNPQWKMMEEKYNSLQSAASTSQPAAASAASVAAAFAVSSSSAFQAQLPPAAAAPPPAPERKHSPGKSGKKMPAPNPPQASVDDASDEEDEDGVMSEHQDEIVGACRMMRSILPKLMHFNNIAAKSKGLEEELNVHQSHAKQLGGRMEKSSSNEDLQAAFQEMRETMDKIEGTNKRIRLMHEFGTLADGMFVPLVRDLTTSLNISKPTTPVNTPAPSPAAVGEGALICGACHKPLLVTSRPVFIDECKHICCGACNELNPGSPKCPCCGHVSPTRNGVHQ